MKRGKRGDHQMVIQVGRRSVDTVDTAEINVSTDLDDTVEINDLVIDENRDVSIPFDSGEVPRIVGGDVPIGDCDGFYDLDSTLPCSQMPRIHPYKKHKNQPKLSSR